MSSDPLASAPPSGRRATLKDVARLAGVSPMTVSNVVNATRRGYNAETEEKVLEAVERAHYRPDMAARSLRTDRRMAIGMLVVQEGRHFLADPYIANLLDGLCTSVNQRGYSLVLQSLHPDEFAAAPLLQQLHTDGLCILIAGEFSANAGFRKALKARRQPIVLFQQTTVDDEADICVIRQDDFEGGRAVCAHLVQRGARNILAVVPELAWHAMRARVEGARSYLESAGVRARLTVVTSTNESPAATQGAIEGYLSSDGKLDALLAGNDQMAIAAYRLLTRRGFTIPGDVLLSGFNGFEFIDYFGTKLTTVRSPAFELGQLGAYHLIRRLETGAFDTRAVVLPTELVVGTTT